MQTIPQDILSAAESAQDPAWDGVSRPTDAQLVEIVALSTGAPKEVVEEWLCDFAGPC